MEFEELLFRAQQDEKIAIGKILAIYRPMLIRNSLIDGYFNEDLYQELVLETLKCIQYFKVK